MSTEEKLELTRIIQIGDKKKHEKKVDQKFGMRDKSKSKQ